MMNAWSDDFDSPDWREPAAAAEEKEEQLPTNWGGAPTAAVEGGVEHGAAAFPDGPEPVVSNSNTNTLRAVEQQQQQQQHQQQAESKERMSSQPVSASASSGGVDGIGLWKSWTHNYEHPRFACLDLLDNCFDATLHPNFEGKVAMKYLAPNGIVILNNSGKPIKSLEETLTAYRSTKNSTVVTATTTKNGKAVPNNQSSRKDAMGEYGVGLKQACATLSNTSFVLTRNKNVFDFGVIAEGLQTRNSVSLPHFLFSIQNEAEKTSEQIDQELNHHISTIMKDNPHIFQLVTKELGAGNRKFAIQRLVDQCKLMWNEEWKSHDHMFQLVVTDFRHTTAESARTSSGIRNHPARLFLEEIRGLLPKHYINVPQTGFEFQIENEKVPFSYWQHRLVEMTKFEVNIPRDKPVQNMPDDSNWAHEGYSLSIYCGFDALRLEDKDQAKACQLVIYSRKSGRLIEVVNDARDTLTLASSGVDFSQGLTVIVDDVAGELPLKPTKDGLTWSKEASGEIHKSNLLAWIGAVAYLYWKHHAHEFETRFKRTTEYKNLLKTAVLSFVEPIKKRLKEEEQIAKNKNTLEDPSWNTERLEKAKFTMFSDVTWAKKQSQNTMKVTIRKKKINLDSWPGPATVFRFNDTHYSSSWKEVDAKASEDKLKKIGRPRGPPPAGRKRKVSAVGLRAAATSEQLSGSSSGSEEEEVITSSAQVRRVARKRTVREAPNMRAANHANTTIMAQHGEETLATCHVGDSAITENLKQELQSSQELVQKLHAELLRAKRQLLNQEKARAALLPGVSDNLQQSLQTEMQKNTLLAQQKDQLERNLQKAEDQRGYEVASLGLDIERLKLELQRRKSTIQRLQGGDGFQWGGPSDGFPHHGSDWV